MTLRRFVELAQLSIVRDAVLVGAVGQVHLAVLGLHRLAARQCDVHHAFVRLETLDLAPLESRVLARPDPHLGATLHSETPSPSAPDVRELLWNNSHEDRVNCNRHSGTRPARKRPYAQGSSGGHADVLSSAATLALLGLRVLSPKLHTTLAGLAHWREATLSPSLVRQKTDRASSVG